MNCCLFLFLFNITARDDTNLRNISIFTNTSGTWKRNETAVKNGTINSSNFTITNIKDGTYKWGGQACDAGGNCNVSTNRTFTIDTTNPVVGNVFPRNNTKYTFVGMNFTYNVTDVTSNVKNCSLWLSTANSSSLVLNSTDTTITETTNQTFNIAFLKNGVFKWNVVCRDTLNRAGNSSKANFSKSRVDSTAPTVTLQKPVNAYNQSANATVLFNCSATDNNGLQNFSLYLNTSGWHLNESKIKKGISNASNFTVINIKDGTYKWNCKVSDNSSNTAFASSNRTFTIDTTNPVVKNVFPRNNTKYAFNGMNFTYNVTDVTSAVSNCSLWLTNANSTSLIRNSTDTSITENINQTFNITSLKNGVFKWNVVCTDKLNNKGNSSKANFSISRAVDTTPPTNVSLIQPKNTLNSSNN